MADKKGMSFDDMRKKRGNKLVYLREPWLNVVVADMYKSDTSCAWIEIAKFYESLTRQKKAKKVAITIGSDTYYWMSFNLIISRLWHYGIRSKSTVSRALYLLCNPSDGKPPLLKRIERLDKNKRLRLYYAKTDNFDALFDTDPEWASQNESDYEIEEDNEDDVFDDPEVPAGTTKDPVNEFPDWFDKQWEVLKASGRFTSCNKCNPKTDVPYKYATDFAKGVEQLIDGTFYKGVGAWIKDKTIKIPEGLTVESIIEAVLSVEGKLITNPLKALVLQTANMNYSPLLKYWEKNGVAGSSTRSQATSPATKPVTKSSGKSVRSNVQYTEEDYKSNRKVMYTYDYIKSYLPNGMVGEMVYGDVSDYWLDKNKFVKKYDNRITNFCLDMQEAYADAGKKRPSMSNVLDTIVGMAQFRAKEGTQKWEDIFWDIIDQMPIYQDCKLWRWFIERFEHDHGEGQSNCDMYKGNVAKKQAMENDAQFRAIEQTAREIIGEDY